MRSIRMPLDGSADDANGQIWLRLREEVRRRVRSGIFGEYDHVELNEVIARPRGAAPLNALTIAVLGEGRPDIGDAESTDMLTGRITVEGFKGWSFGVARTFRPVAALDEALEKVAKTGVWALSGRPIGTGTLRPEPTMFVPPDATRPVPLNKVLKTISGPDHTWSGS